MRDDVCVCCSLLRCLLAPKDRRNNLDTRCSPPLSSDGNHLLSAPWRQGKPKTNNYHSKKTRKRPKVPARRTPLSGQITCISNCKMKIPAGLSILKKGASQKVSIPFFVQWLDKSVECFDCILFMPPCP